MSADLKIFTQFDSCSIQLEYYVPDIYDVVKLSCDFIFNNSAIFTKYDCSTLDSVLGCDKCSLCNTAAINPPTSYPTSSVPSTSEPSSSEPSSHQPSTSRPSSSMPSPHFTKKPTRKPSALPTNRKRRNLLQTLPPGHNVRKPDDDNEEDDDAMVLALVEAFKKKRDRNLNRATQAALTAGANSLFF